MNSSGRKANKDDYYQKMKKISSEICTEVNRVSEFFSIVLSSGDILFSTLDDNLLAHYVAILPNICEQMQPKSYIVIDNLYISRISRDLLLFVISDVNEEIVQGLFADIISKSGLKIFRIEKIKENTGSEELFHKYIKVIVFSMARKAGPEPIVWYPKDGWGTNDVFKITMKSMLNLADEIGGAHKSIISTQPFLQYDSIGVNYFFQIPFSSARGNAFDSCITILVDYNKRAIFYEKYQQLSKILERRSHNIIEIFQNNANKEGNFDSNVANKLNSEIIDCVNDVGAISIKIDYNENIEDEMIESLRKLRLDF